MTPLKTAEQHYKCAVFKHILYPRNDKEYVNFCWLIILFTGVFSLTCIFNRDLIADMIYIKFFVFSLPELLSFFITQWGYKHFLLEIMVTLCKIIFFCCCPYMEYDESAGIAGQKTSWSWQTLQPQMKLVHFGRADVFYLFLRSNIRGTRKYFVSMSIEDFGQKPLAIVFKGKDPLHTKHSLFVLPIYLDCVGFICSFSIEIDMTHKVIRRHFACLLK